MRGCRETHRQRERARERKRERGKQREHAKERASPSREVEDLMNAFGVDFSARSDQIAHHRQPPAFVINSHLIYLNTSVEYSSNLLCFHSDEIAQSTVGLLGVLGENLFTGCVVHTGQFRSEKYRGHTELVSSTRLGESWEMRVPVLSSEYGRERERQQEVYR